MKLLAVLMLLALATVATARSHHHRHVRNEIDTPQTVNADPTLYPLIINTWAGPFTAATDAAYQLFKSNPSASALDIVEYGASACEHNQCDGTVGFGGSPDENCESTLDALIMDGNTFNVGAVAGMRRIKDAMRVARHVLEYTQHTMLVGDLATEFAIQNGFKEEPLSTNKSLEMCKNWKTTQSCQPNFRVNVSPDPTKSCGPYTPNQSDKLDSSVFLDPPYTTHDTVSMIVFPGDGSAACGTSTNGATWKIPGRVGDGPITGSGSCQFTHLFVVIRFFSFASSYSHLFDGCWICLDVDADYGGCGSTGSGDIMMR